MAVLLQLRVELTVQLVDLLPRLLVLDELADQKVRALPDLLVEPGPRYPVPLLLERSRPRLGVQVVGVHQRPVYVEHHDLRHLRPPRCHGSWLKIPAWKIRDLLSFRITRTPARRCIPAPRTVQSPRSSPPSGTVRPWSTSPTRRCCVWPGRRP